MDKRTILSEIISALQEFYNEYGKPQDHDGCICACPKYRTPILIL